jgi:hypothetical protein
LKICTAHLLAATMLAAGTAVAAENSSAPGLAQWCTNDQHMATKEKVYDPTCPGTEVKRNPDGTWGSGRPDGARPTPDDLGRPAPPAGGDPGTSSTRGMTGSP